MTGEKTGIISCLGNIEISELIISPHKFLLKQYLRPEAAGGSMDASAIKPSTVADEATWIIKVLFPAFQFLPKRHSSFIALRMV